jgi:glycine cleavage system H protein
MNIPSNLKYSSTHEWINEGDVVSLGITDFAQKELGDIVFINLPKIGDKVTVKAPLCDVESVKAVSEIISPVSGSIIAINESLETDPELINKQPYDAWICQIKVERFGELMNSEEYAKFIEK